MEIPDLTDIVWRALPLAGLAFMRDPAWWVAVGSAVIALLSMWFARSSANTARQALKLAMQQEARRQPRIVPYLADGFVARSESRRIYALSLSLSNPTDSDNSLAMIELQVRYRTPEGIVITARVPHLPSLGSILPAEGEPEVLVPPTAVGAHKTTAGWVLFEVSQALLGDSEIDEYRVILTDSHSATAELEPCILREVANAATAQEQAMDRQAGNQPRG